MTVNSSESHVFSAMTKQQLMEKFKIFGKRLIRSEINRVIVEVRGVSLKEAKDQKVLRASEVAELEKRLA